MVLSSESWLKDQLNLTICLLAYSHTGDRIQAGDRHHYFSAAPYPASLAHIVPGSQMSFILSPFRVYLQHHVNPHPKDNPGF